jgi:hypothetical protein
MIKLYKNVKMKLHPANHAQGHSKKDCACLSCQSNQFRMIRCARSCIALLPYVADRLIHSFAIFTTLALYCFDNPFSPSVKSSVLFIISTFAAVVWSPVLRLSAANTPTTALHRWQNNVQACDLENQVKIKIAVLSTSRSF